MPFFMNTVQMPCFSKICPVSIKKEAVNLHGGVPTNSYSKNFQKFTENTCAALFFFNIVSGCIVSGYWKKTPTQIFLVYFAIFFTTRASDWPTDFSHTFHIPGYFRYFIL